MSSSAPAPSPTAGDDMGRRAPGFSGRRVGLAVLGVVVATAAAAGVVVGGSALHETRQEQQALAELRASGKALAVAIQAESAREGVVVDGVYLNAPRHRDAVRKAAGIAPDIETTVTMASADLLEHTGRDRDAPMTKAAKEAARQFDEVAGNTVTLSSARTTVQPVYRLSSKVGGMPVLLSE